MRTLHKSFTFNLSYSFSLKRFAAAGDKIKGFCKHLEITRSVPHTYGHSCAPNIRRFSGQTVSTAGQTSATEGSPALTLRLQGMNAPDHETVCLITSQKKILASDFPGGYLFIPFPYRRKKTLKSRPPFHLPKTSSSSQASDQDRTTKSPSAWLGTTPGDPRPPKESLRVSFRGPPHPL